MIYQNVEIKDLVNKARNKGWDGSFPVCSQYIAFRLNYTTRKYAKLGKTGKMEDGDTISIGSKMDEKWSRIMVAHIIARHDLYKEYNFIATLEDVTKEETNKDKKIKNYTYELMIPSDFLFFLLTERKQTNKMILMNTFGVPEEVFDERLKQLGIDLVQYREKNNNDSRSI